MRKNEVIITIAHYDVAYRYHKWLFSSIMLNKAEDAARHN